MVINHIRATGEMKLKDPIRNWSVQLGELKMLELTSLTNI